MSATPGNDPVVARTVEYASRILELARFPRGADHKGWTSNGIFYRRDSAEALARLARVIELKRRIASETLMLSHDTIGGKKGLRIWWRPRNSAQGGSRRKSKLTPEQRALRDARKRAENLRRLRERAAEYRAAGLCTTCGCLPPQQDRATCRNCIERRQEYAARKRRMRA